MKKKDNTTAVKADLNQDGIIDAVAIDSNGDGVIDAVYADVNQDGAIDAVAMDLDGDGIADVAYLDPMIDLGGDEQGMYAAQDTAQDWSYHSGLHDHHVGGDSAGFSYYIDGDCSWMPD